MYNCNTTVSEMFQLNAFNRLLIIGILLVVIFLSQVLNARRILRIKLVIFVDITLDQHLEKNLKLKDEEREQFFAAYIRQVEANLAGLHNDKFDKIKLELVEVVNEAHQLNSTLVSTGDIDVLLDEFCKYQSEYSIKSNKRTDWHLSLLLTSNDMFSTSDDQPDSKSISGISLLNGINWPDLSCLIVEFGVNFGRKLVNSGDSINNNNPTRGFASTWVATHEIGHSLGLHHDGFPFNRDCDPKKFVMSSSSFVQSMQTIWSQCSIDALDFLSDELIKRLIYNHNDNEPTTNSNEINYGKPGEIFDLDKQCQIFSANLQVAKKKLDASICNVTVWCQHDAQLIAIGPALEGTRCDIHSKRKVCQNNRCIITIEES